MTIRIDTPEQFEQARASMQPVYVTSKRHGRIRVPCMATVLVATALVRANDYNPNHVSADKMALLQESILGNGWCFPVVAIWDDEQRVFVIIDGFHRSQMGEPEWLDLDYLPLVFLEHDMTQRLLATVQFNKARGVHQVDLDAEVIRKLAGQGLEDGEIAQRLGIELDTVYRYKQVSGIAELFRNTPHSPAWEVEERA